MGSSGAPTQSLRSPCLRQWAMGVSEDGHGNAAWRPGDEMETVFKQSGLSGTQPKGSKLLLFFNYYLINSLCWTGFGPAPCDGGKTVTRFPTTGHGVFSTLCTVLESVGETQAEEQGLPYPGWSNSFWSMARGSSQGGKTWKNHSRNEGGRPRQVELSRMGVDSSPAPLTSICFSKLQLTLSQPTSLAFIFILFFYSFGNRRNWWNWKSFQDQQDRDSPNLEALLHQHLH